MSATNTVSFAGRASGAGLVGDVITRLGDRLRRAIDPGRLLFRGNDTAAETVVARHGPVEVRATSAGWVLETCVKGELEPARAKGMRRLANFVNGRGRACLRAARPLVQTQEAAGRWRLRVAVPGLDSSFAATAPRNGKVRLRTLEPETLAVIRVSGRPTPLSIHHAETAIRQAIAGSLWEPMGPVVVRLHALPAILPFLSRYEVALPVTDRAYAAEMPEWVRHVVHHQAVAQRVQ
ncbi:MAG: heme-binding protein [Acetobacteraceae bacterium]